MATNDPRSDWAEALEDFGPDAKIYEGDASRAALADLLDGKPAIGGEAEVSRRLRGRPSLTAGAARGHRSRQLNVRIGGSTEERFDIYIARTHEKPSDILRQALEEFLDKRSISA